MRSQFGTFQAQGKWADARQQIALAFTEARIADGSPITPDNLATAAAIFLNMNDFDLATQYYQMAQDAGMKYIVITSKHHDGFCLWDTKATKYNVVAATPYGKDLLKPRNGPALRKKNGSPPPSWCGPLSLLKKTIVSSSSPSSRNFSKTRPMSPSMRVIMAA